MKRIGIFGGTFNPIHMAHLVMAQVAFEKLKLDRVVFVPSNLPPHKSRKDVIAARYRYQMVRLAISDNPAFDVSDIEIKRPGKSYSIDTVHKFQNIYSKNAKFFFIIGTDSLAALHQWKRIDELRKLTKFVVINRPGFKGKGKIRVQSIEMPGLDLSSSQIRLYIREGASIQYLVPAKVASYIKQHQLYK